MISVYEKIEWREQQPSNGSAIILIRVLLLWRAAIPSVAIYGFRAQTKKAAISLILIQGLITLHEILHLNWFSTRHYFILIALLIVFQFLNFYAYIYIVTTQPGIIQKIVAIFAIKSEKYEMESNFLVIPKNEHILKSHNNISYIIPNMLQVNKTKFCLTCNIYRPPRTSHCDLCGVCI